MMSFKEFLEEQEAPSKIIVSFTNSPSKSAPKLLFESLQIVEEGKTKEWGKGYSYRLDRRPANQGGDQLHIQGRKGQEWAYRHTGQKSEPNKYTFRATNMVKDIVSDIFKIDKENIEEAKVVGSSDEELLIEVTFA